MKKVLLVFVCVLMSAVAFAQMFEGRKYRELIESDSLSYSRMLSSDSSIYAHRIDWKTHEMRFYKYNDSAATIVLMTETYSMPLRVKFINEDGNKVYEPKYLSYLEIYDTDFKGEVAAIMHNEKENFFFFALRNNIRDSFFMFYQPLE
jgi:hypothetical protein